MINAFSFQKASFSSTSTINVLRAKKKTVFPLILETHIERFPSPVISICMDALAQCLHYRKVDEYWGFSELKGKSCILCVVLLWWLYFSFVFKHQHSVWIRKKMQSPPSSCVNFKRKYLILIFEFPHLWNWWCNEVINNLIISCTFCFFVFVTNMKMFEELLGW